MTRRNDPECPPSPQTPTAATRADRPDRRARTLPARQHHNPPDALRPRPLRMQGRATQAARPLHLLDPQTTGPHDRAPARRRTDRALPAPDRQRPPATPTRRRARSARDHDRRARREVGAQIAIGKCGTSGIRCPLLAIQGEQDEYATMAQLDAIARGATRSPRAEQMRLEGCGHAPHRERADEVVAAIARLVDAAPEAKDDSSQ